MHDNYCLPANYEARTTAETFVEKAEEYWTEYRRQAVGNYQFHVHEAAARLVRKHGLSTVLDIGCGYPTKAHLLEPASLTLVDQPSMAPILARDFSAYRFIPDNLEAPSVMQNERFDLVICADVLEHLLDPDPCMAFIHRTAERFAVLSTPERVMLRGPNQLKSEKPEHVREWSFDEFARYVRSRGFEILAHKLTSQGRLSVLEQAFAKLCKPATKRFAGCQYMVCKPRIDGGNNGLLP